MRKTNVTRSYGLLETFLAKKRASKANELIKQKSRSGKILDIGCGTTPYFLMNTKFKDKYGLDPLVKTQNSDHKIILKKFDIEKNTKLPFKDNNFDVITMLAVFEHIDPDKIPNILIEIRRILKPKGRFILTTPCTWTDKLLRTMAIFKLVSAEEMKEHKAAYTNGSLISYLNDAGFERDKISVNYFELFLNHCACSDK
ncbi:MAG: methyltransferase domain-containing protein [Candidatus Aenigmarchaeota archaeon]|nr:methyltransferase domain-containing protein [Candidatus Aenigmarchaeota archaeon]MCK5321658.1 methyltransferase domain-containing protein [Candidatus Aenigmarchaeota archaeon]